jgi:exosortase D (VPLPA-CTERM-specific)
MTIEVHGNWNGRPTAAERWTFSSWCVALVSIVSLTLAFLTARDGLADLYRRWRFEEEYGHGFLVVGLVAFILWKRRDALRAASAGPGWPGLALVIAAQLGGLLGVLAESYYVEQISLVLTMLGLMLALFGARSLRTFLPLAILLMLTIPLPYTLQAMGTVKLQLLSTDIGVFLIRLVGIPVFVEGNIIDLGEHKLHVAEACSGLRYLLPLTCIGFLFAYLYHAPYWKKAIVLASAPVITLLINGFRIAVSAVLVDNFGIAMAEGFMHQAEGWIVFLLGTFLLFVVVLVLERFRTANINLDSIWESPSASNSVAARPLSLNGNAVAALLVCASALGAASAIAASHELTPDPVRQDFSSFPRQIANWKGHETLLDAEMVNALKATDYYSGSFARSSSRDAVEVGLFVGYYASLSKGGAIHSPRVCLPSSGWEFSSIEQRSFGELAPGTPGSYNRIVIQKGEQRVLMYYWIQQRERRTASEFSAKYYLLRDNLLEGRRDGALVRFHTPVTIPGERGLAEADARLRAFSKSALPELNGYLP